MEIPKQLHKEIIEYCKLNSITDVDKFIIKTLTTGFTIAKYGMQPTGKVNEEVIPENKPKVKAKVKPIVPEVKKNITKSKPKDDLYGEG